MVVFSFSIPVPEVLSENFLYRPGFRNRHSFLYLDPKIAEYKGIITSFIKNNYDLSCLPDKISGVVSEYRFNMNPDTFWNRDVTNAVKAVEDAVFTAFRDFNKEIDDSLVISNTCVKLASNNPVIITKYAFLDNQDQNMYIMRHSVFDFLIGGECA